MTIENSIPYEPIKRPVRNQQVNVYFEASERAALQRLADEEERSVSYIVRACALRGLRQYQEDALTAD